MFLPATARAATLGGLGLGLLVQFLVRRLSSRPIPRPVMTAIRLVGAAGVGYAAWLVLFTPGGSGTVTGPETSTTSAPEAAAAAAMAWPCRPEERLAM